jgi:glycosyltransferase involved in cell wall biosynthesis
MPFDVSVVIPTFNRAALIGETIQSILAQTRPASEIIVVDDGSTDDTERVVASYGGTVRYHRIDNVGPSAARNVGVSLARGSWIAFCDSDDLWRPTKLERQIWLHELAPEVEYSFTDFAFFASDEWSSRSRFAEAPAEYWEPERRVITDNAWIYERSLYARILRFHPIAVPAVMMTRRLFERLGGYDERFSRGLSEDMEFTLRCIGTPPTGVLAEPLVGVRKHAGNRSADNVGSWLAQIRILEHALAAHAAAGPVTSVILDEIQIRRALAAARAFVLGRLDVTRALAPAIDRRYRDWKLSLMIATAGLPAPIAERVRRVLVAAHQRLSRR